MTGVLIKRGNLNIETVTERRYIHIGIRRRRNLQVKRRNPEQVLLSRPSGGPHLLTL